MEAASNTVLKRLGLDFDQLPASWAPSLVETGDNFGSRSTGSNKSLTMLQVTGSEVPLGQQQFSAETSNVDSAASAVQNVGGDAVSRAPLNECLALQVSTSASGGEHGYFKVVYGHGGGPTTDPQEAFTFQDSSLGVIHSVCSLRPVVSYPCIGLHDRWHTACSVHCTEAWACCNVRS
jgi:hypothetical protein